MKLIEYYTTFDNRFERNGVVYMDYSEYLVEQALIEAGFDVVSKDAYYFNGKAYRINQGQGRPKDLDYIAKVPKS